MLSLCAPRPWGVPQGRGSPTVLRPMQLTPTCPPDASAMSQSSLSARRAAALASADPAFLAPASELTPSAFSSCSGRTCSSAKGAIEHYGASTAAWQRRQRRPDFLASTVRYASPCNCSSSACAPRQPLGPAVTGPESARSAPAAALLAGRRCSSPQTQGTRGRQDRKQHRRSRR